MSSDASDGTVAACHTGDAATTTARLLPRASEADAAPEATDVDAPSLQQVRADELAALTARHAQEERALTQLHTIEDTTYLAVMKEAANVDTDVADTACPAYYVALRLKHKREQSELRKVQLAESVQFCHTQRDQYDAFVRRQERARAALAAKQRHEIECALHDADDPTFVELLYRDLLRNT